MPTPAPGPKGKTVIGASYLTIRGTIKAIDKESVTLVEASGRERTAKIAENALVAEGLATGDKVVLRVPLQKPFDGKTTDRVERPKPPKTPPPSNLQPSAVAEDADVRDPAEAPPLSSPSLRSPLNFFHLGPDRRDETRPL